MRNCFSLENCTWEKHLFDMVNLILNKAHRWECHLFSIYAAVGEWVGLGTRESSTTQETPLVETLEFKEKKKIKVLVGLIHGRSLYVF